MAIRRGNKATGYTRPQRKPAEPPVPPDPLPEDTYGAKRWAMLQADGYIWFPDLKRAIYDQGQRAETIAEP